MSSLVVPSCRNSHGENKRHSRIRTLFDVRRTGEEVNTKMVSVYMLTTRIWLCPIRLQAGALSIMLILVRVSLQNGVYSETTITEDYDYRSDHTARGGYRKIIMCVCTLIQNY